MIIQSKIGSGVCAYGGCTTRLSRYNLGNYCAIHERLLVRAGLVSGGGSY